MRILLIGLTLLTMVEAVPDSLTAVHPRRNAVAQALGVDFGLWAVNNYVTRQPWARISMESFRNNIRHGWVMDEDEFDVNQFGHPYQGALVFTAARAQGLDFWQSIPYPILSSFIWEIGLETEYPSINDMITTPLSGITYGEITHRLSLLLLEEPGKGRNVLAFLVNPSQGMNRLFGNDHLHQPATAKKYNGGLSLGAGSFLWEESDLLFPRQFARFHIFYGDPYDARADDPFDFFTLVGIVNFGRRGAVNEVYSSGLLKSFSIVKRTSWSRMMGLFKNYDYMNHDDFKVSSTSLGPGLIQTHYFGNGWSLYNEWALAWIILGSAGDTSDEDRYMRDYLYGPGFSGKFVLVLEKRQWGNIYLRIKRYLIYNGEDLTLAKYENVNLLISGFQAHVWKDVSLG
ncbi:MAG: DUF3943 domain-containing protein, partial [FCB group bacterium]|nr:DUF3943 domain-containing protein [FCB group bacterium]